MKNKINKQPKSKIRTGDLVQVITGDSKGKQGKVLEVLLDKNRVVVEGANMVFKHTKPNAVNPNGGRPPYDIILMFKILVLQRFYNLSDDQTEYQINDRMSFGRFLGLSLGDTVPDAKTIWHFR